MLCPTIKPILFYGRLYKKNIVHVEAVAAVRKLAE